MMQPINDPNSELNQAFCRDMDGWGKISSNITIWNYNTNFRNYLLPTPNLRVIEPNIRYFRRQTRARYFSCRRRAAVPGDFSDLRNYMIANLLWDPNGSGEQLMREFLDLHYGPAAPPIRRFIDLLHDNAEARGPGAQLLRAGKALRGG